MIFRRFVIEGERPGPRLLIVAGVHGDEFEPMLAVRRLADEVAPSELGGTLVLIPVVNENAYRRSMRCADDGLDLARTCPGSATGSITERVAHALAAEIRCANYFIDLHTGGSQLRLLPLTGYMLHTNAAVLTKQRDMATAFGLPLIWGTSPELEGRSLSVARDASVPAIYAEHGGAVFDRRVVVDYREGCRRVMRWLEMLEGPELLQLPRAEARCVEDRRPQSGHLQLRHPAPVAGIFVASVELGSEVDAGDSLGEIIEMPSGETTIVKAECSGLVLMLHTSTEVAQGSGLAVILELNEPR